MSSVLGDLRSVARGLAARPLGSTIAVVALALAIGSSVAVFSAVEAVLLTPLPFHRAERLVRVWDVPPDGEPERAGVAPGRYADWREEVRSFDAMAAARVQPDHLTGGAEPLAVDVHEVTPGFLATAGVRLAAGRDFHADDLETGEPVAILTAGLARRLFGGSAGADRTVTLHGTRHRVVGVAAGDLDPLGSPDLWVPLSQIVWTSRSSHGLGVVARLRNDATVDEARRELEAATARAAQRHPRTDAGWGSQLVPVPEEASAAVRPALLVLSAAAVLVLLVACVNVSALLLARALGRRRELAVRSALGAPTTALLRLIGSEALLVAAAGGVVGILLAWAGLAGVRRLTPPGLSWLETVELDGSGLAAAAGMTLFAALAAGAAPLARLRHLRRSLESGGPRAGGGHLRALQGLVAVELALAVALVASAALLTDSFLHLRQVDLGFRPQGVLAVEVGLSQAGYTRTEERSAAYEVLVERIGALPGVDAAGAVSRLPLSGASAEFRFLIEGRPPADPAALPTAEMRSATNGYFAALGIPLAGGRHFDAVESAGRREAVLVNRMLADRAWPDGALGRRLSIDGPEGPWRPIVGVVEDVRHFGPAERPRPEIYVPLAADPWPSMTLVLAARNEPRGLAPAVRRALREVDEDLPATRIDTLEELYARELAAPRFLLVLVTAFAALAVVLAGIGLYGTQSYSVSLRRHELAVRLSVGAGAHGLRRLVLAQALRLAIVGLAAGTLLTLAAGRLLGSVLYGVVAADPGVLVAVAGAMAAVTLAAAWLPAQRAAATEPALLLRSGE